MAIPLRGAVYVAALPFLCGLPSGVLHAKTIFYGPTPYLSSADSLFDLSGLGATFWLEDFEDRELNTPGVSGVYSTKFGFATVDSVDADDGQIDGSGSYAGSGRGAPGYCTNAEPPSCLDYATFEFSADALGGLPTAVGVVWTDGFPFDFFGPTTFIFTAFDPVGGIITSKSFQGLGGDPWTTPDGDTSEDRFIGVRHDAGIASVSLEQYGRPSSSFEFDHLQYGFQTPEPSSIALFAAAVPALAIVLHRRLRKRL